MRQVATIVSESMVRVIDINTGEEVTFFKGDANYEAALESVRQSCAEEVFDMDVKSILTGYFVDDTGTVEVAIEDGGAFVTLLDYDMKVPLEDALTNKILKMYAQGFDCQPMVNFIGNLYSNPSSTAISELYLFIDACELPITEDGHFIAYKIVNGDYTDCHSSTIDNSVGQSPSMPRNLVDDDRNRTCSHGLHFCSKSYVSSFGSVGRRCMIVKINPADVVSIPSDYNNAKGRTWTYEVVGELPDGWLKTLPTTDYTDKAVVGNDGAEIDNDEADEADEADDWEESWESSDSYDEEHAEWIEPAIVCPVVKNQSTQYDDAFVTGYKIGFEHGKKKQPKSIFPISSQYGDGYTAGYKDGKNKKGNKYK